MQNIQCSILKIIKHVKDKKMIENLKEKNQKIVTNL